MSNSATTSLIEHQPELKLALANFRLCLKTLRQGLHLVTQTKAPDVVYYENRLKLLVPLYRALNCVYQQINTKSTTGIARYIKVFQKLQSHIDSAATKYEYSENAPMFKQLYAELDYGTPGLVLLVPSPTDTPTTWHLASIDMLLMEAEARVKNQATHLAQKQRAYALRKRALCRSLDASQRHQLNVLLALARDLGWSSVALTPMDAIGFSEVP